MYEGWVGHTRRTPHVHRFRKKLFLLYLDLAELPDLFDRFWFWSARRWAPVRFKRSDYLGPENIPLRQAVAQRIEAAGLPIPSGPVRVLTQMRQLGYVFNPLSLYFCFDDCEKLELIVADVSNTPWGERHSYVLPRDVFVGDDAANSTRFDPSDASQLGTPINKEFHVSPFLPMDLEYRWRVTRPGERMRVSLSNWRGREQVFIVEMQLRRQEINHRSMAGLLLRYPFMPQQAIATIYWHAFRLWRKKTPFFPHPNNSETRTPPATAQGKPRIADGGSTAEGANSDQDQSPVAHSAAAGNDISTSHD